MEAVSTYFWQQTWRNLEYALCQPLQSKIKLHIIDPFLKPHIDRNFVYQNWPLLSQSTNSFLLHEFLYLTIPIASETNLLKNVIIKFPKILANGENYKLATETLRVNDLLSFHVMSSPMLKYHDSNRKLLNKTQRSHNLEGLIFQNETKWHIAA